MISRLFAVGLVAAFAVLAGCSQDAASEEKAAMSAESELTQRPPQLLGIIENNEQKNGYYYQPPQSRAWAFRAQAGDTVTIDVTSRVGDAVAFLTDDRYNLIAYNDDARPTSLDAQIVYTIPSSATTSSFRIVFADYDARPAPFDVHLSIETTQAGPACSYGAKSYPVGAHFPARDGCNTCHCKSDGIECTKSVCACNPGGEPDKFYMYSPSQCEEVHVTCPAGMQPFQNDCGCGCKRP